MARSAPASRAANTNDLRRSCGGQDAILASRARFRGRAISDWAVMGRRLTAPVCGTQQQALTARVLGTSRYRRVAGSELKVGVFRHGGRRLVVSWSAKRARKDAHDRRRAVAKLIRRLGKSTTPKQLLGTSGYHRYVRVVGDSSLEIDEEKIRAAEHWDGLHRVVTNLRGIGAQDLFDRYRQLRQVEESFRITKHDLRVRPVFHWTDRRIRAHLAIAFMAYACVRHLARRVALQKRPLSPRVIREALNDRQCSVLHDPETDKRYVIPSRPSAEARAIYATLGLSASARPYGLGTGGAETKSARS